MNCPVCGKTMTQGKVAYAPSCGLHFLPPHEKLPYGVTKGGIEKRGGVPLDGPYSGGNFRLNNTAMPGHICKACRRIVMEY